MKLKFESWVINSGLNINLSKNKKGEYKNKTTQQYFLAWASGYNECLNSLPQSSIHQYQDREYLCSLGDLKIPEGVEIKGLKLVGFGSWRGSYNEPCLFIVKDNSSSITHQELEEARQALLTNTFHGYKGGEYQYNENSWVYIEESRSAYSDGKHLKDLVSESNIGLLFS